MPKFSLFAEEECENRCEKLGDPLAGLIKHVDFTALATVSDDADHQDSVSADDTHRVRELKS
ncbi:MAG: hypothetical protein Q7R66_21055 [Undibacterium sp.]|nr:hypothetical protein [Undibacterium sp.]